MYIATFVDEDYNVSILKDDNNEIIKSDNLEEMIELVRADTNEYKEFKNSTYGYEIVIQEYNDAGIIEFTAYKSEYTGDALLMCWKIHKIDL